MAKLENPDQSWTPIAPGVEIGWTYAERSEFPGVAIMVADHSTMPDGFPMIGFTLERGVHGSDGSDTTSEWACCLLTIDQARKMARLLEREAKKAERIAGQYRKN